MITLAIKLHLILITPAFSWGEDIHCNLLVFDFRLAPFIARCLTACPFNLLLSPFDKGAAIELHEDVIQ